MSGNRGLFRASNPPGPGLFPWSRLIHGYGSLARRPRAGPGNQGLLYFAADDNGGTLYKSQNSAWVRFGPPVFGAAGATHTTGLTPDPGITADSFPKVLLETAAWGWKPGEMLGTPSVVTATQSTTSATPVDLATADSVTFTLDATTNLLILWCATVTVTAGSPTSAFDELSFDGTLDVNSSQQYGSPSNGFPAPMVQIYYKAGVGAGSRTVKMQHFVQTATTNTATWGHRCLAVFRAP